MFSTQASRQKMIKRVGQRLSVSTHDLPELPGPSSSGSSSRSSKASFRLRLRRRSLKILHKLSPSSTTSSSMSPLSEVRLRLLPRIAEFKSKKWINEVQGQEFLKLLSTHPEKKTARNAKDSVALQVQNALDAIQEQQQSQQQQQQSQQQLKLHPQVTLNTATPIKTSNSRSLFRKATTPSHPPAEVPLALSTTQKRRVSFAKHQNTKPKEESKKETLTSVKDGTKKAFLQPKDAWTSNAIADDNELQELFVEMCFFARLGFVQPPSCLHCVYRESTEKKEPDKFCERWVIWRKNANTLLHPNRLDGNLMLVQCHAARALVEGKPVQSHQWDKLRRQLVYHM